MVIEIPYINITIPNYAFYILIAIFLAAILLIVIYIRIRKRRGLTEKDKGKIFNSISKLTKQKARIRARAVALRESTRSVVFPKKDFDKEQAKYDREINKIDKQIDKELDKLSRAYFAYEFEKEAKLDHEKVSYLVTLQQGKRAMENEIFRLKEQTKQAEERKQEAEKEKEEHRMQLDIIEEKNKQKILDLEMRLDVVEKKYYKALKELEGKPGRPALAAKAPKRIEEKVEKYHEKMDEYFHKNLLLNLLVSRYSDYIGKKETKTIQDLKNSVQPRNTHVVEFAKEIMESIPGYDPDKDILKASELAYYKITDEIHSVPSLGINFWMTIKEIFESDVADYEDKAILLCSVFKSLGSESSIVIAEMSDRSNRPFVVLKEKGMTILCDPNEKHEFQDYVGPLGKVIKQYEFDGNKVSKILYEFNDKEYKEY